MVLAKAYLLFPDVANALENLEGRIPALQDQGLPDTQHLGRQEKPRGSLQLQAVEELRPQPQSLLGTRKVISSIPHRDLPNRSNGVHFTDAEMDRGAEYFAQDKSWEMWHRYSNAQSLTSTTMATVFFKTRSY